MTDLTPVFREILSRKPRSTESAPTAAESPSNVAFKSAPGGARVHLPSAETADEFLKEAYRIVRLSFIYLFIPFILSN